MCCENVRKELKAFAGGRLPVDRRRAMQSHLAGCAACRDALGRVDPVAGALAAAHTLAVPQGLAARVMMAARQRRQVEPLGAWDLLRWWRLTSRPMHLAAAAVLVIGLTLGLAMGGRIASSAQGTSVSVQGDPLAVYRLDVLAEAPEGSLVGSYLSLVAATNGGGH